MEKGKFITKSEANMLQGIAVMLMVYHHLFGFPERIGVPYSMIFDFSFLGFETVFSYFGRICISMFAFISGYGMCKMAYKRVYGQRSIIKGGYKMICSQLGKFYPSLWAVCVVFIPVGYIIKVYSFNLKTLIKALFGFSDYYNAEWWYTPYYLKFLLVFPVLFLIFAKLPKKKLLSAVMFICMTVVYIMLSQKGSLSVYLCFISGMLVVNSDIFEIISDVISKSGKFRYLLVTVVAGVVILVRMLFNLNCDFDFIITPVIIFCITVFLKSGIFKKTINHIFMLVGKYSTYIWLTHTFFAYYYFQKITYAPKYSVLIFVWCLILTIATGFIIESAVHAVEQRVKMTKNYY